MEEDRLTTFKVGDILQPKYEKGDVKNEDLYWLVKQVRLLMTGPVYDVENIRNRQKLFGIAMHHYEKIP